MVFQFLLVSQTGCSSDWVVIEVVEKRSTRLNQILKCLLAVVNEWMNNDCEDCGGHTWFGCLSISL